MPAHNPTHSNKHGGIATFLVILLLIFAIAGVIYFFYTESQKEAEQAETVQIATRISQSLLKLQKSPTPQELQRIENQIETYQSRANASPDALASWQELIESAKARIAEIRVHAEQLQDRIDSSDSTLSQTELDAFDAEIKTLVASFDASTRNQLLTNWSQRKNAILAEIRSVSATIIAKTFPSGAKTYLNGEYIGLSSLGIQNVRKGKQLLSFEKEGYLPAQLEIQVNQSGTLELETVELQIATQPFTIVVSGGKPRAKILVSIEKSADGNKDLLLYIAEKEGRQVTFEDAPLGPLTLSVTADLRLVHEQVFNNTGEQTKAIEIKL